MNCIIACNAILFFVKEKFRDSILTHTGVAVFVHFEVRDKSIQFSIRMESPDSYCTTPNTRSMPYQHDAVCFLFNGTKQFRFLAP